MAERNKKLEKMFGGIAISGQISHVDTELIHGHQYQGARGLCTYIIWGGQQGRPNRTCDQPQEAHAR